MQFVKIGLSSIGSVTAIEQSGVALAAFLDDAHYVFSESEHTLYIAALPQQQIHYELHMSVHNFAGHLPKRSAV